MSATTEDPTETRWRVFWDAAPYAVLATATLLAVGGTPSRPHSLVTLGLAALAAGWMWFVVTAHPQWTKRLAPMLGYFAVLLALTGLLIARDRIFSLFTIGLFVQVLSYLPGLWAYLGVAATAALPVAVTAIVHEQGSLSGYLPSFLVNLVFVSAIGFFIRSTVLASERRREALAELAEAHDRLAEYAEQNAELQARLIAQAREAGVRAERTRLAGEIHDTLAQGLTGIVTQLEAAEQAVEQAADDPSAVRRRLAIARDLARESLSAARRSVQALRPELLDSAQLPDAVTDLAARWSATAGIPVEVRVTGTARALHPEVEVTLLRAVQEALANVARHAVAGRVGLTLSYMEDIVVLDVRDDGMGFGPSTADARTGYGLIAMRQRVTRLGGTLTVESAPGQGTAVSASVMALPPGELLPPRELGPVGGESA